MKKTRPTRFSDFTKERHAFAKRVHAVVRDIPEGETMTYGAVAYKAGYPGAARAVGNVMRNTKDASVPFHRVIPASGKVGNDAGALRRAVKRLAEQSLEKPPRQYKRT